MAKPTGRIAFEGFIATLSIGTIAFVAALGGAFGTSPTGIKSQSEPIDYSNIRDEQLNQRIISEMQNKSPDSAAEALSEISQLGATQELWRRQRAHDKVTARKMEEQRTEDNKLEQEQTLADTRREAAEEAHSVREAEVSRLAIAAEARKAAEIQQADIQELDRLANRN